MEPFETRKVGKHLFIFEKGKAESSNEKSKGRTLITSCSTETDDKLPPEFLKYMRRLFDILDENKSGYVKLSDIEAFWGHKNGYSSSESIGVLQHLRRVVPANGLLSFERLCMGFSQAIHSTERSSTGNGFPTARNGYEKRKPGKYGQSSNLISDSASIHVPPEQISPVFTVQDGKQGQIGYHLQAKSSTFGDLYKSHGIWRDTRPRVQRQKHKPERQRPRSMGFEMHQSLGSTNSRFQSSNNSDELCEMGQEIDSELYETYTYSANDPKERTCPISMGQFAQSPENVNIPFRRKNPYESGNTNQKVESRLTEANSVSAQKNLGGRRRPKSVVPFSEQNDAVDLSVAKKKGGILEGIQKTDKKAVIDKLKQWRDEELKKSSSSGRDDVTKQLHRVTQGYQSDGEGSYYRQRRTMPSRSCTGNETDFERLRNSVQTSSKSGERRLARTTVCYQGQIQTKNEAIPITTAELHDPSKATEMKCARVVGNVADELHTLREGLRIVDELRGCLLKRIADIQEQKLYEQLDKAGLHSKEHARDIKTETSAREKNIGKTGRILEPWYIESLSSHFKGLKTILDQAKRTQKDY